VSDYTTEELERWIDRQVIDIKGHRVGLVADVYIDDATGRPEWLAVMTGLFGTRISFVPLQGMHGDGDKLQVAYDKALIKDSPNMDGDGQLNEEEEERLYQYYGLTYENDDDTDEDVEVDIVDIDTTNDNVGESGNSARRRRLRARNVNVLRPIDLNEAERAENETDAKTTTE
jgi:sporulation protein YlmC with PRC-barrel domain